LFAAAHAGIEALRDDVGQAIVDDDLDFDLRIALQEFRQLRQKDGVGGIFRRRDAQRAGLRDAEPIRAKCST
jgi:hypothetical protein